MDSPHLAFPIRFTGTSFDVVEQQSPEHVIQQAEVVVRTRPGMLEAQPTFGLPELAGRTEELAPILSSHLERFVPDARLLVEEDRSQLEQHLVALHVEQAGQDA
jgi:hypothetical protein